jgi:hypothetical protein
MCLICRQIYFYIFVCQRLRLLLTTHLLYSAETPDEADKDDEDAGDDEDVGHRDVQLVPQQNLDVRLVHHCPDAHAKHQETAGLKIL